MVMLKLKQQLYTVHNLLFILHIMAVHDLQLVFTILIHIINIAIHGFCTVLLYFYIIIIIIVTYRVWMLILQLKIGYIYIYTSVSLQLYQISLFDWSLSLDRPCIHPYLARNPYIIFPLYEFVQLLLYVNYITVNTKKKKKYRSFTKCYICFSLKYKKKTFKKYFH